MSQCCEYRDGKCASGWVVNAPSQCMGLIGDASASVISSIPACMMDDPPSRWIDDNGLPLLWKEKEA